MFNKYQRKRDMDSKYQKKKSTIQRRRELRAEDRRNYFTERQRITNPGDYHKFQFENALSVRNAAYDSSKQSEAEPQPSTSYEQSLQNATRANSRFKEVLRDAKEQNLADLKQIKKRKKNQRRRRKNIQARNAATNACELS